MTVLGLAAVGGILMGVLCELMGRSIYIKDSILRVQGAPDESWSLASIVAVRRKNVSERVARIEVDIDEGKRRTVILGVRAEMAGRVVEELRRVKGL